MFSKKNKKNVIKGFTLIEMLIVIVIIGILAAAIFPKLWSARGRANDVARKADLSQAATALVAYQIDHGSFPSSWCSTGCPLNVIASDLISAGMNSIPSDPNTTREISEFSGTDGQYYFLPISKWGISKNGFILVAATETIWGSNWNKAWLWTTYNTYEAIQAAMCNQDCTTTWGDNLRYIYIY